MTHDSKVTKRLPLERRHAASEMQAVKDVCKVSSGIMGLSASGFKGFDAF